MEKGQHFNELRSYRYGVTSLDNDSSQASNGYPPISCAGPHWELVLNITYQQLGNALRTHFGIAADDVQGAQCYRNHLCTLNSFLAFVGKTLDSRIGVELNSGFDATLRQYLDILEVSARTKRDRRSHLLLIRRLRDRLASPPESGTPARQTATSLSLELRVALARSGLAPKALARQASVSPSAVQRWLKGAAPNRRGIPTLRRIESALGLKRDHLVRLVPTSVPVLAHAGAAIPYRDKQRARAGQSYAVPESSLPPEFLAEWQDLLRYKTSRHPRLARQAKGTWRCIPADASRPGSALARVGERVSPTADYSLARIRYFFGVISMAEHRGRLAQAADPLPLALAWLASPEALETYLEWLTARSDGTVHKGQTVFCGMVASLLRPATGYLWQRPELAHRLPESVRPANEGAWRTMCEQSHALLLGWKRLANGVSRDPVAPIAFLLGQDEPLKPLFEAIRRIDQVAAGAPAGSISEARLRRDALLLGMLIANPLRLRAYMSMTWSADGTGSLYGNAASGWRIRLEQHQQKNGASQRGQVYDVRVADWLSVRLEAYLDEYRETLLQGCPSRYLFPAPHSGSLWKDMARHVTTLTRRHVPGCPGFGPHAFRHLVATYWLERFPNDYLTVAELLNDRLETVMAHYAHLKKDNSFRRYEAHLNEAMGAL